MADVTEQRIYCAEQILVPDDLPNILKHYSKAVIRENPSNIVAFSAKYFKELQQQKQQGNNSQPNQVEKPNSNYANNS